MRRALLDLDPLRESPGFRRLWTGQVLSGLGGQMAQVAVLHHVWESTRDPVWTGAAGVVRALPLVVFGLSAGSLADRTDRRRLFLITTTGQAACAALLAVGVLTGSPTMLLLLTVIAIGSVFAAGAGPAGMAVLPRLLPADQIAAGLALKRIGFQVSMLLGPALGGLIIALTGPGVCFLIDAVTFVGVLWAVSVLPPMPPLASEAPSEALSEATVRHGVIAGLRFLAGHRTIRAALLTDLAATVLVMPISLLPMVNAQRFGGDPRALGLFLSAIAAGGVAASALSGSFTRLHRPGQMMLAGSLTWSAAIGLFGVAPDVWSGLALLAAAGAADTVAVVSRGTVVQSRTPDAYLGRVMSAEQVVGSAGPDLGNLRGGLVAAATSGPVALVSGGVLGVLAVVLIAARTPELRRG